MFSMRHILAGLCATACCGAPFAAHAQNMMGVSVMEPGETNVSRSIKLGLNKSTVIELDRAVADVVITNPDIADAVVQTSQRLIFRGVEVGETNAFLFDRQGNPLLNLEIIVDADTGALEKLISRYVPDSRVKVESVGGNIVVSGNVDNLMQSDQVMRLVKAYAGGGDEVEPVNMLSVAAKDQVMLEVRVVEMQRNVVKQLGINLSGSTNFGDLANMVEKQLFADLPGDGIDGPVDTGTTTLVPGPPWSNNVGISSANGFNVAGNSLGGLSTDIGYTNYVDGNLQSSAGAAIDALERVGVVRTLAEPNISAVSGESANFLAGGEFPVPVGQDNNGRISIEFKQYGVGLAFTPVVLSEGRISLKVSTEVSELTNQGSFQGQSVAGTDDQGNIITAQTLTIPALTVRRAESTVELPSGGSMMMAGLIQSRSRQSLDQLPGLKKLPILGALFQSRDFMNEETELVVIITPYLVDPTQKGKLRTPADGYANASDPKTIFFGKLNAMYGKDGKGLSKENYNAPVGFIEE
ncbi:type II and III secretion system protein family protein [Henriciella aquimarina]|uniref:type II and III secretion system protein family protein n=1 Tax=Henriciella aquimarina TaxID=545261 RepID=UPI0009FD2823|nr:type II and III secretion system protein family protein [Henriciella aquimarina]